MKEDFIKKWQSDRKYKAKIKLLLYAIFIIFVTIYAIILNKSTLSNETINEINNNQKIDIKNNLINIPEEYQYKIIAIIDDQEIEYNGIKTKEKTTITKKIDNTIKKYIYQDNNYYIEDNNIYLKTTQEEVYDIVSYNYINLDNINNYLEKATKNNNQYLVYLKDIVLNNNSEDYFVIVLNDNNISIDYTPLVKLTNKDIKKYKINIEIEEYKEVK